MVSEAYGHLYLYSHVSFYCHKNQLLWYRRCTGVVQAVVQALYSNCGIELELESICQGI